MTIREKIIKAWMEKAKEEYRLRDGLNGEFQFANILISCWISFEAFTCLKYQKDGVGERIRDFSSDFKDKYSNEFDKFPDDFKEAVRKLSEYEVIDMRPNHIEDKPKDIKDFKNLQNVLDVVYQVRNNLFHGGKDIDNVKDKILIECSAIVLYRILEKFLIEERYLDW